MLYGCGMLLCTVVSRVKSHTATMRSSIGDLKAEAAQPQASISETLSRVQLSAKVKASTNLCVDLYLPSFASAI